MKNWIKILLVGAVIGIGSIVYIWFFVYNKPHKNIEKSTPDYIITANECYNQYAENQNTELVVYTGKVLQITGTPTSVENTDSLTVITFVFNEGVFGDEGIRCTLLSSYNEIAENLNLSEFITIKGYCSGYNDTDVILEQCSIINN